LAKNESYLWKLTPKFMSFFFAEYLIKKILMEFFCLFFMSEGFLLVQRFLGCPLCTGHALVSLNAGQASVSSSYFQFAKNSVI